MLLVRGLPGRRLCTSLLCQVGCTNATGMGACLERELAASPANSIPSLTRAALIDICLISVRPLSMLRCLGQPAPCEMAQRQCNALRTNPRCLPTRNGRDALSEVSPVAATAGSGRAENPLEEVVALSRVFGCITATGLGPKCGLPSNGPGTVPPSVFSEFTHASSPANTPLGAKWTPLGGCGPQAQVAARVQR